MTYPLILILFASIRVIRGQQNLRPESKSATEWRDTPSGICDD
jgi:hypothetical protein